MQVGMEGKDLTTSTDHGRPFMEEDHRGSSRGIWKVSGGSTPHQLGQEDVPEVSGVSFHLRIRGRKVIPVNCDEPVGLEVGLPLVSDHFLKNLPSGVGSLMDPVKSLVQRCSGLFRLIHSLWS